MASDLGLHCLPMSQKWDALHIWVNESGSKGRVKLICLGSNIT